VGRSGAAMAGFSFSNSFSRLAAPEARTRSLYTSVRLPNAPAVSAAVSTKAMMVPPLISPCEKPIAPRHTSKAMPPRTSIMMVLVIIDLTEMRRLAVSKVASTVALKRSASRVSWLKACTMRSAPRTSLMVTLMPATRSWLDREIFFSRRPNHVIGSTTTGMPISRPSIKVGISFDIRASPPIAVIELRSAMETVVPTACSISVVSDVIRLEISAGLFSSKKLGGIRSKLVCTPRRISATTRSPSQLTL